MVSKMVEYIRKDKAIATLVNSLILKPWMPFGNGLNRYEIESALKVLPDEDVYPILHGTWIENGYTGDKAVCNRCGEPCGSYTMGTPRDRYCKWCGARMDGEQDE